MGAPSPGTAAALLPKQAREQTRGPARWCPNHFHQDSEQPQALLPRTALQVTETSLQAQVGETPSANTDVPLGLNVPEPIDGNKSSQPSREPRGEFTGMQQPGAAPSALGWRRQRCCHVGKSSA